jgi:hypothetical protein
MAADTAEQIVEKARELLAEHDRLNPEHIPLTYGQIEDIWEDAIRPRLKDFASMQSGDEAPPEDSRWHRNWRIPDLG